MQTDPDCIFCKIVAGDIPSEKVVETDTTLAFKDINPIAPVHVVVIPKSHVPTFNDFTPDDELMLDLLETAREVARKLGVYESGYRVLMNVQKGGGQIVFHYHLHVVA